VKKLLLAAAILCSCTTKTQAADILWNPAVTHTIPSDGNTYYVDFSKTLTTYLTNNGTLEIRSDGIITTSSRLLNQGEITIQTDGTVYTYSTIDNGSSTLTGTLTINQGGKIFLLSGNLINRETNSEININSGGELDNFYGIVNNTSGDITLASGGNFNNVRGSDPGSFTNNGGLYYNTTKVVLVDDLDIDYTWTITEKATIHGNNNKINLGANGAIEIQGSGASLLLKDVIIDNISGNQIRCTDNTTTLSIDNVTWIQDANYSFTKGALDIKNNWLIKGTGTTFSYQSDQTSTINSYARLVFQKTVFDYDTASNNLLQMSDSSSLIILDRTTLQATQACTLATGKLLTRGLTILQGDATLNLEGLADISVFGALTRYGTVQI
jgi:hypothetical protein